MSCARYGYVPLSYLDMNDAIERLEALRDERLAEIKGHKGHIESLEDEINRLGGEVKGLEVAIKLCSEDETPPPDGTLPLLGKYRSMDLTPAVLDVIETSGVPPGLLVPEIIKKLIAEGFKSRAENLYAGVYSVGLRLVKQDKIQEGKKNGRRSFMKRI